MRRRRVYGDTVTGMDTGTLDMLHDTRNQDIVLSVTDRIYLDFFSYDIFIYQNRVHHVLIWLIAIADKLIARHDR